jgi:HlyD family secretion protein
MNPDKLQQLQIDPARKARPNVLVRLIVVVVTLVIAGAMFFAWPRKSDETRVLPVTKAAKAAAEKEAGGAKPPPAATASTSSSPTTSKTAPAAAKPATAASDAVLIVSGYIITRERIELSPRFPAVVKWIGVKKGDPVKKDQVVVLLDDTEQKARLLETEGAVESARVALARAELNERRITELRAKEVTSQEAADLSALDVRAARAALRQIEGTLAVVRTNLDWTVIKSPIDGVVLEKLVEPNELVMPQSFGGPRGPSTALVAVADPNDLQVEIDVNEADLAKISLGQKCRVSPEAYPDKRYEGVVAEISPEANRSKGTLQLKVQVKAPDRFLTPELSAKVEFLRPSP